MHTLLEFTLSQYVVRCPGRGIEAGSIDLMASDVKAMADELGIPVLL